VQDNQSLSARPGTVRGLHFQGPPAPQAKLVRVLRGSILDVAVDLRRGSPTFGRWCGAMLTASGGEQLFLPRGFAHGFCTLEPDTEVAYKMDGYHAPECEAGVLWNDPEIGISWPVDAATAILS
jgi:dTDP-4-dehydrorhamnose 3,5-epimerase